VALTTDGSNLTAIGNDYGFDHVFARQIEALGRPGDVAVAISTSGRSANVLAGVAAARARGLTTIAFTGGGDGPLTSAVDIAVVVPSLEVPRIQECHRTLEHILCELVEALVLDAPLPRPVPNAKMVPLEQLVAERAQWRAAGRIVAWTNGCFDVLHVGHLASLTAAAGHGDVLIVGLNDDDSVRALKGQDRPLVPALERAALVGGLEVVDRVVIFAEQTPEQILARVQPDVHCKGADYAPPDGKPIPEQAVVEAYGGLVVFLPLIESQSTSELIRRSTP
jgi:rfaE bifunctional protein nucleotidyltransferase chain/domain